uniref:Preprotein-translocase subunit g n=1 Tax=Kuetzingia canaliculata TaxID=228262 RepID=A0A1Z1MQ48_KUECA|nr:preprotein-translocase subunit g [Kuetzingia canaliculata]ARW67895.1 preprotein-translocase subunit g [Kuetzingia canaliculata]
MFKLLWYFFSFTTIVLILLSSSSSGSSNSLGNNKTVLNFAYSQLFIQRLIIFSILMFLILTIFSLVTY